MLACPLTTQLIACVLLRMLNMFTLILLVRRTRKSNRQCCSEKINLCIDYCMACELHVAKLPLYSLLLNTTSACPCFVACRILNMSIAIHNILNMKIAILHNVLNMSIAIRNTLSYFNASY